MNKIIYILFFILCIHLTTFSQELSCQITINSTQVQGTVEKQVFDQLQKAVYEFMNNTKWTKETFLNQEKIDCSLLLVIKEKTGTDSYKASIQVQSRRPVYKSGYYTPLFNYEDDNFEFAFQQFSALEFNLNTYQNNLTSVLAFYAYVVIATDYDSFSPNGGTEYWQRAQLVVNNAQSSGNKGWLSNEQGQRNRYWIIENTLQPVFNGIRACRYEFSRNGLDIMHEKPEEGRAAVLKALGLLKPVYEARPASFIMQLFFNAKADEIINIFKTATPEEKNKVVELLMLVDPANTTKYLKIQGER